MGSLQPARCLLGRWIRTPATPLHGSHRPTEAARSCCASPRIPPPTRKAPCHRHNLHTTAVATERAKKAGGSSASASATATASATASAAGTKSPRQRSKTPKYSPETLAKLGCSSEEELREIAERFFPRLTEVDYEALRQRYTPAQLAAVRAGESAIDPVDLALQARDRTDMYAFDYLDDFAEFQPSIDRRPPPSPQELVSTAIDPKARWMTQEEFDNDLALFLTERSLDRAVAAGDSHVDVHDIATEQDLWDFVLHRSKFVGGALGLRFPKAGQDFAPRSRSLAAPMLPAKVPGVAGFVDMRNRKKVPDLYEFDGDEELREEREAIEEGKRRREADIAAGRDPDAMGDRGSSMARRRRGGRDMQTELSPEKPALERHGWTEQMLRSVHLRTIENKRVTNQTRLGKVYSQRYTVIAGNGDGWIGIGMAKGQDEAVTPLKAKALAIINMRPIPRYEERTIFGNVRAKFGATVVELYTSPPGYGLRVPQNIWHICRFAGIKDIAGKMPRANNKMNTVKATIAALHSQKDPEEIAIGRGQKLVDARKVYYGGLTL